jgi:hypothetical protein
MGMTGTTMTGTTRIDANPLPTIAPEFPVRIGTI